MDDCLKELMAPSSPSVEVAYNYARWVIHSRWPKGEKYIMKDPYYAYNYARRVIKNRWPEAEDVIMSGMWSGLYVKYVIKKHM